MTQECHENVTRRGLEQPCDKPAVAYRLDPQTHQPYPVCPRHVRAQMVTLADQSMPPGSQTILVDQLRSLGCDTHDITRWGDKVLSWQTSGLTADAVDEIVLNWTAIVNEGP